MAVATLFDSEKFSRGLSAKRGVLKSFLVHGPQGDPDDAAPVAPPHAPRETSAGETHTDAPPPGRSEHEALSRSDYLRRLEDVIRRTERTELDATVVEVTPREVQRLVRKAAKAKARYLAAALDAAEDDKLPDAATIKALNGARERHEVLESGLQSLLTELRRGSIAVAGLGAHAGEDLDDLT